MSNVPSETTTIGDDMPKLMAYVRDEVLPLYQSIGAPGAFACAMIRADLDAAAGALARGDIVDIVRMYQRLKDIKT